MKRTGENIHCEENEYSGYGIFRSRRKKRAKKFTERNIG
jgi:hypothetical protein